MRKTFISGVACVAFLMAAGAASAQFKPQPSAAGEIVVKTVEAVDLSGQTVEVTARLSPEIVSKIGRGGDTVRLIGMARGVKASGGSQSTIGQIVWNGVGAEVNGRKRVAPLDKPLTSQFVARSTNIAGGTEVKAAGSEEAIIAAARKLLDVRAEETRKEPKEKPQNKPAPVGGGGSTNEIAAQGIPTAPGVMRAEEAELPVSYGVTTEGCTPRVDEAQGVVIIQSRQTKSEGGAITPVGDCSDSETRYMIQKSYASCTDRLDTAARKAYAQYRKYWTDDQGRTSYLGDCVDDPETVFEMVEDVDACTYEIDLNAMMAFERAELVYTNRTNQRVLVESCRRTGAAGLPITRTADGCTLRHDFTARVSYQQKRLVYTNPENAVVAISECADDPQEVYPHVDVRGVCADLVDQTSGQAWPQRRWQINALSGRQWISDCEPVADEVTDLVATVEGCESTFFHYPASGQSFGAHRFYYSFDGGATRTYVTTCLQSTVNYAHQSEIQGYEYHDPEKFALPKTALYINTAVGRVDVSPAQVREGAPQIPYTFVRQRVQDKADGKYYEGCNAFVPTELVDVYERPDGTEVFYVIGSGEPLGPVDECIRVTETRTVYSHSERLDGFLKNGITVGVFGPNFWATAKTWVNTKTLVLSPEYNHCSHNHVGYTATFVHMNVNQQRVRTTYPDGSVQYSEWTNNGAPYQTASYSCYTPVPDGA